MSRPLLTTLAFSRHLVEEKDKCLVLDRANTIRSSLKSAMRTSLKAWLETTQDLASLSLNPISMTSGSYKKDMTPLLKMYLHLSKMFANACRIHLSLLTDEFVFTTVLKFRYLLKRNWHTIFTSQ